MLFDSGGSKNKMALGESSRKLRQHDKIRVYVVEDHNEVLRGIYREIGRKRLPMTGCLLLHLDSHSDLSIPKNLKIDDVFDKESLFSIVSIENWIMPAVFAGHIDTVVWIRPPWTKESFELFSTFSVGHHVASGEIRVSSKSNYFLSELSFAPTQEMVDCKPLNLYVLPSFKEVAAKESGDWLPASSCPDSEFQYRTVTEVPITDTGNESSVLERKSGQQHEIGGKSCCESDLSATTAAAIPKCSRNVAGSAHKISDASRKSVNRTCSQTNEKSLQNSISKEVGEILQGRSDRFILDIDLDFFSTTDPLQAMLTPSQQKLFRALYQYTSPIDSSDESISTCVAMRQEQISYLETVMKAAQNKETLKLGDSQRDLWLKDLLADLNNHQSSPEVVDFEWLHEIGTGIDDCELPHHITPEEEIRYMIDGVEAILNALPRPAVITIARSSSDDYCPVHQVDFIETYVLEMLCRVYSNLDIKLTYL